MLTKRNPTSFEKFFQWIGKHNWHIVGAVIFGITLFEIAEIYSKQDSINDPYHIVELFLYIIILILVGIMVHFLVRAHDTQAHMMQILKYKHDISLILTKNKNWESLTDELVKIPNTIVPIKGSRLFVQNSITGELELVTNWNEGGMQHPEFHHHCLECSWRMTDSIYKFSPCVANEASPHEPSQPQEFCLPINYGNSLFAIIQFKLKDGGQLAQDQIDVFENIGPEISLALKASQERKYVADMRNAQTALAERHSVSTYLHDHLSQNLAYICLKLDQLSQKDEYLPKEYKQSDLRHMIEAANQSYEILRDMIETVHPETTPRLINLIKEHAKKVSDRSHIEISIETSGQELSITPDVQKAVFFVFREALSNIEKHADAKRARVFFHWDKEGLNATMVDDGNGFDLQNLGSGKHFGLEIMQERVDQISGQIDICSSPGSGTEIKLFIPILSLNKKKGNDV